MNACLFAILISQQVGVDKRPTGINFELKRDQWFVKNSGLNASRSDSICMILPSY